LRGADRAIQHEVGTHPEQRIRNDEFGYRRNGGNMLILIAANIGEEITWNELTRVVQALHRYMTGGAGTPETHYQELDFQIRTLSRTIVGFGLVRYFSPGSSEAQKRASLPPPSSVVHETDIQLPNRVNPKKRNPTTIVLSTSVEYPTPNTPVTLIITSLGAPIPSFELEAGLTNALRKIRSSGNSHAHDPIPGNNYWYRNDVSHLWFNVLSITGRTFPWQQLIWAVTGLLQWMKADTCQELAFEVEVIGEGIICFGSVGYDSLSRYQSLNTSAVEKRTVAAKTTSLQLPGIATVLSISSSVGECTIIPDMGIELCFRSSGLQIPAYGVKRMFDGAFAKVQTLSGKDPQDRVPNNFFRYADVVSATVDSVSITIQGSSRATILWIGLQKLLIGLEIYMKGIRPRMPNQEPHYQILEFDIITFGNAKMGMGWVRHTSQRDQVGSVESRTNANDTSPQLSGIAPTLTDIESYGRALISGPDLEIHFRYHGDAVSPSYINALFHQALLDFPISEDIVLSSSFRRRTPYSKIDGGTSINIEWLSSYRGRS